MMMPLNYDCGSQLLWMASRLVWRFVSITPVETLARCFGRAVSCFSAGKVTVEQEQVHRPVETGMLAVAPQFESAMALEQGDAA